MNHPPIVPAQRLHGLGITLIRRMMGAAPADAINLGIGQVDADVPAFIQQALRDAKTTRSAPYGPTPGYPPMVRAIADRYGVEPARVIVTIGVEEAIAVCMFGMVNPGDHVLLPDPAFPVYGTLATLAGGQVNTYALLPETRFRPTWAAIEAALTPETRLVMICSPGNPTGAVAEPEEYAKIGRELEARGIPFLADEIYEDIQGETHRHETMYKVTQRGFVTAGLSKSHALAGWRLGWLISPPDVQAEITALHQYFVTSAPSPLMEAATLAFSEEGRAAAKQIEADLIERRRLAIALFEPLGFEICAGDGAFYLFVRHQLSGDDLDFTMKLMLEGKVIMIPGQAFGPAGKGFVRISYASHPDKLREAAARTAAWLATQETA